MEKLIDVEVRRKAKVDGEWRIADESCKALIRNNKIYLFFKDTDRVFSLTDKRAWWFETEKGMFMGSFISTSTYEDEKGIEVAVDWEYTVRSV